MKLHEIIETMESGEDSVLIESLIPYKKSLQVYYTSLFPSEPLLMVTAVFNACQYGIIVPCEELHEAISIYHNYRDTAEDHELISFQSIMLKDF